VYVYVYVYCGIENASLHYTIYVCVYVSYTSIADCAYVDRGSLR
jgi:hypothetical protein